MALIISGTTITANLSGAKIAGIIKMERGYVPFIMRTETQKHGIVQMGKGGEVY